MATQHRPILHIHCHILQRIDSFFYCANSLWHSSIWYLFMCNVVGWWCYGIWAKHRKSQHGETFDKEEQLVFILNLFWFLFLFDASVLNILQWCRFWQIQDQGRHVKFDILDANHETISTMFGICIIATKLNFIYKSYIRRELTILISYLKMDL